MEDDAEREKLVAIQHFYSARTVAHATFFLSSIFGLFTILSLIVNMKIPSIVQANGLISVQFLAVAICLLFPYIIVWFFGLYSLFNYKYYAAVAEAAQAKIVGPVAGQLIRKNLIDKEEKKIQNLQEKEKIKTRNRVSRYFHRLMKSLYLAKSGIELTKEEEEQAHFASKLNRKKMWIFLFLYIALGLLPLIVIWILS